MPKNEEKLSLKLNFRVWDEKGGLKQDSFVTDNLEVLVGELFKSEIRNNIHSLVFEKATDTGLQTLTFENKGFITKTLK